MKHLISTLLLVAVWAGTSAQPFSTARTEPDTDVRDIIDKALARMHWSDEQYYWARYRHSMSRRTRKFNDDGEVTDDQTRVYAVEPYRGVPYAKLISKNGDSVAGDDLAAEKKRWKEFLEALDNPPAEDDEADDNEIVFNEELIGRYTAELDGIRELRGRPSYVLTFKPKPGKLPVRRRLDHALNKSRGEIWIDQQTYEVARVSFALMERVRLWWGILGSVSEAIGHADRQPVTEDAWLPSELDIYIHVRVLFSTTRRGQISRWGEFEPVAE